MSGKTVFIRCTNHFDPIWRRPFKRSFPFKETRFVAHEDIERACIDEWLAMARRGTLKFEIECTLVLRTYLDRRPEELGTFRRLHDEGRFELLAAGEVVPDTNLPGGETLIRNLVLGLLDGERLLGAMPSSGCLNDAFGQSAQMPQIFRGCGVRWVTGLSYKYPRGRFWKGLDGSVVFIDSSFKSRNARTLGPDTYYGPCPGCGGLGCPTCAGRGFDLSYRQEGPIDASGLDLETREAGVIQIGGEETLVPIDLPERVEAANERGDGIAYRYLLQRDAAPRHALELANIDAPDQREVAGEVEGNPTSSGSLVSRIKIKQGLRRAESLLLGAEAFERYCRTVRGMVTVPVEAARQSAMELKEAWRSLALVSFHDGVTGSHIDPAYDELLDLIAEAARRADRVMRLAASASFEAKPDAVTIFNPTGYAIGGNISIPCQRGESAILLSDKRKELHSIGWDDGQARFSLPPMLPFSCEVFVILRRTAQTRSEHADAPPDGNGIGASIENEHYRVRADGRGIDSIIDKATGEELVDRSKGWAGELVLERDSGDPWATRELDRTRTRLGPGSRFMGMNGLPDGGEFRFSARIPGAENVMNAPDYRVRTLEWDLRVSLYPGQKRVDFRYQIHWDTFDRRIRVSFPTLRRDANDRGWYSIPYGWLARDRYEMGDTGWLNANGDWPGLDWASTAGSGTNIAVLNRGTPSYRIEDGEILVSVLRSPTFPNGLYWPHCYDAPVYDGMRDHGRHTIELALTSFEGAEKGIADELVPRAREFGVDLVTIPGFAPRGMNNLFPFTLTPLAGNSGAAISAVKKAEAVDSTVLRIWEYGGTGGQYALTCPAGMRAYKTDMVERARVPLISGRISLRPFEIATVLVETDGREDWRGHTRPSAPR